ncbi:ferredoxin [Streptomyces sp. NPDC056669]|uniref:ferredoxin n=1 Tax=unclassified Streptomyces TaxID=2593676 RepID=UPI003646963E
MRARADRGHCCGFGNCSELRPEVFALDEEDNRARVLQQTLPTRLVGVVLRAAHDCPTAAITVGNMKESI